MKLLLCSVSDLCDMIDDYEAEGFACEYETARTNQNFIEWVSKTQIHDENPIFSVIEIPDEKITDHQFIEEDDWGVTKLLYVTDGKIHWVEWVREA